MNIEGQGQKLTLTEEEYNHVRNLDTTKGSRMLEMLMNVGQI